MFKRHFKKLVALVALLGAAFYLFWPGLSPDLSNPPRLYLSTTESYGTDTGAGNVIGIEPFMEPLDYATAGRFQAKLEGYLDRAKDEGWIGENTIVLLPEHIGTGLMAVDHGGRVYGASSVSSAKLPIITYSLIEYLMNLFIFDNMDRTTAALVRTRTRASSEAQFDAYSSLAQKYGITLVTGSSALMTPGAYPVSLSYGRGPIFNAGFVFGPDGKAQFDAIRKVHLQPFEKGFTKQSRPDFLPVFEVGGHKLGVLIGADSHYDDTTEFMANQNIDLLLVPAVRYSKDPGSTLPARSTEHITRWGMTVFLKGDLWGINLTGQAQIIEDGTVHTAKTDENSAAIYNLWLK